MPRSLSARVHLALPLPPDLARAVAAAFPRPSRATPGDLVGLQATVWRLERTVLSEAPHLLRASEDPARPEAVTLHDLVEQGHAMGPAALAALSRLATADLSALLGESVPDLDWPPSDDWQAGFHLRHATLLPGALLITDSLQGPDDLATPEEIAARTLAFLDPDTPAAQPPDRDAALAILAALALGETPRDRTEENEPTADHPGIAPGDAAPVAASPGPLRPVLDLSTAHLSHETVRWLRQEGRDRALTGPHGLLVWSGLCASDGADEPAPSDLRRVLDAARPHADYVLFDADGPVSARLPTFDW